MIGFLIDFLIGLFFAGGGTQAETAQNNKERTRAVIVMSTGLAIIVALLFVAIELG